MRAIALSRAPWRASRGALALLALLVALLLLAPATRADEPGKSGAPQVEDLLDWARERVDRDDAADDEEPSEPSERDDKDDDKEGEARASPAIPEPLAEPLESTPDWMAPLTEGAGLWASGAAGLVLLGTAVALGRRASRPRSRPSGPLEAARDKALRAAPATPEEALEAVRRGRYGKVVDAQLEARVARVALKRRRSASCEEARAFVGALFEMAWGLDVEVEHACEKGRRAPCVYDVRAQDGVTSSARPGGGASTRGSST